MKNIKENNIGAAGLMSCCALSPCIILPIIGIIFLIIVMIIAGIISLVWGIFGLVGFSFLCAAAFILLMNKGKVTMTLASPFVWCVIIGIIMMILSALQMEAYYVDLSFIPGLSSYSMNIFGTMNPPCSTC